MVHSQNEEDLLNIVTNCPRTFNDSTHIGQMRVISDFPAEVTLYCVNGNITKKDYTEVSVKFFITIDMENIEDEDICVMHKVSFFFFFFFFFFENKCYMLIYSIITTQ